MSDFDFMQDFADGLAKALNDREHVDGRDKFDLPYTYQAEARISAVSEDSATVKVTLDATRDGYPDRKFSVTVTEDV